MGSTSTVTLSESEYGIIPRVIRTMFESIENQENQDNNRTYRVRIQYLEIYGEELRDLLDQNSSTKVTIRETPAGGVYVSGTREELVTSAEETLMALEKGSVGRTTGSTLMNQYSSRSHGRTHTIHLIQYPLKYNTHCIKSHSTPHSDIFHVPIRTLLTTIPILCTIFI